MSHSAFTKQYIFVDKKITHLPVFFYKKEMLKKISWSYKRHSNISIFCVKTLILTCIWNTIVSLCIYGYIYVFLCVIYGALQVIQVGNPPINAGDAGDECSIPGLGRSPGVGNGNPLHYSCLDNPMDRGAWRATTKWLSTNNVIHTVYVYLSYYSVYASYM